MNLELANVDISDLEMDQMPGFNFSWWYTGGEIEPGNIYTEPERYLEEHAEDTYPEFVRDVVLSSSSPSPNPPSQAQQSPSFNQVWKTQKPNSLDWGWQNNHKSY